MTFTQTIEGKVSSTSVRLNNARNSVSSDATARSQATVLAGTPLVYNLGSKTQFIDSRGGTIKTSWTWTDRDANTLDVTVQTQEQNPVLAIIPIPGRAAGPIIQDLGTQTSEIVTVTMKSKRNTIGSNPAIPRKPTNLDPLIYLDPGTIVLFILSDSETWNPISAVYERVARYLIDTQ